MEEKKVSTVMVELGSPKTLADMIKAGRYDHVRPDVTEQKFPIRPELFTTEGSEIFHFGRIVTTAEAEAIIRARGCEPATIERLFAYGAANPEEQRKYPISATGSSWVDPLGHRHAPCLHESNRQRIVLLDWSNPQSRWLGICRFLAFRK